MQYQIKENCLTIFLPAEVDHHNAEEIKREADKVIEEQHIKYVIFDFGRTNFMDSSGIGVIMGRYRHIFLLGGEVWAIHTSERMRQILNMSGVICKGGSGCVYDADGSGSGGSGRREDSGL